MYFLYKHEYRTFKAFEITIRRGPMWKEKKIEEMKQFGL
jgi:hypothetical protein